MDLADLFGQPDSEKAAHRVGLPRIAADIDGGGGVRVHDKGRRVLALIGDEPANIGGDLPDFGVQRIAHCSRLSR
jgi:hypothetical protein